jgi:multicomponent Na+:H+ antiporter subunit A
VTSLILDVGTKALFHTAMLLSLYLLFVGHNSPGGGFIGGLVGGAALVLRYVALTQEQFRRLLPLRPEPLLGLGVLAAGGTGMAGYAIGGEFLASGALELDLPLLGHLTVTSVLFFDIGVYLVVLGLALMIIDMLGAEAEW